jgi:hypothetical protein
LTRSSLSNLSRCVNMLLQKGSRRAGARGRGLGARPMRRRKVRKWHMREDRISREDVS